jgi:hypothetical protein
MPGRPPTSPGIIKYDGYSAFNMMPRGVLLPWHIGALPMLSTQLV